MTSASEIFSLGFMGSGNAGSNYVTLIFMLIALTVVIFSMTFLFMMVARRIKYAYIVNIYQQQSNGILFKRDFIRLKHDKERGQAVWWLVNSRCEAPVVPSTAIIQIRPHLIFKYKGVVNYYADDQGNLFPAPFVYTGLDKYNQPQYIITPELRDWKESFVNQVVYRAQKLLPQKWYNNIMVLSVVALAVVGIMIVIMIKVGGPMIPS